MKAKRGIAMGIVFGALVLGGCGDAHTPEGSLVGDSGCKQEVSGSAGTGLGSGGWDGLECIEFSYDGSSLLDVRHVNATFNCCPGKISADISVNGSAIIIEEREREAGCYCICRYDLDYHFEHVAPGIYTILIKTPYLAEGSQPLEATVDLIHNPSGRRCIEPVADSPAAPGPDKQ